MSKKSQANNGTNNYNKPKLKLDAKFMRSPIPTMSQAGDAAQSPYNYSDDYDGDDIGDSREIVDSPANAEDILGEQVTTAVEGIFFKGLACDEAIHTLMTRPSAAEGLGGL